MTDLRYSDHALEQFRRTSASPAPGTCRCGHPENHCSGCGQHFVVTVLARDHEHSCPEVVT